MIVALRLRQWSNNHAFQLYNSAIVLPLEMTLNIIFCSYKRPQTMHKTIEGKIKHFKQMFIPEYCKQGLDKS